MSAGSGSDRLPEAVRRTGSHELFFDLVFVFGITEVSTLLGTQLNLSGFAKTAVILGLMSWILVARL
jgi:low temperature requirement protein LtrA